MSDKNEPKNESLAPEPVHVALVEEHRDLNEFLTRRGAVKLPTATARVLAEAERNRARER